MNLKLKMASHNGPPSFIDDVVHVVAHTNFREALCRPEQIGKDSLEWGKFHGAIFDQKKAKLMHFTKKTSKTFTPLPIQFGNYTLQPQTEV
ncbi:hypothetical protein CROQUDRAFT_406404 [Cronartium quercuum f. sp. fusiforme G11]|uniref:Uncharacterized protein n=1 Tax=Cronartium quercuum f. sp. fusiforme G11 TaxID=708437 RepID=A0A9P6NRF1_9BASI|nr:hypothetical protein CROQUDRAFT_406404 [Cronartium quercuum f. sp. fusiforme G11]